MEVTYQLEREDYRLFQEILSKVLPFWRRFNLPFFFFLFVLVALEQWKPSGLTAMMIGFLSGAVFTGVLVLSNAWGRRMNFQNSVDFQPGAIGLHTILLHPGGFDIQSSTMRTSVEWSKVTQFGQSKKLVVFFVGSRFGFIVPKRAFATPEQAQTFLETVQAYRKSALDGTAPNLPSLPETWPPTPQRIIR